MTANFYELFINDINSSIIKMDGNSLANASVIIYKIYEISRGGTPSRRKKIHKIYEISLACEQAKKIYKIYKISLACEQEKKETNSIYSHNSRAE